MSKQKKIKLTRTQIYQLYRFTLKHQLPTVTIIESNTTGIGTNHTAKHKKHKLDITDYGVW